MAIENEVKINQETLCSNKKSNIDRCDKGYTPVFKPPAKS